MLEALSAAVGQFFQPAVLVMMLAGSMVGLIVGILPGIGGLTAMAILIPFVYGMDPLTGLAFLLSAHAVTYTGGSVTAIMLGIPGTAPNAATVIDGYVLARQGKAGYAIGAALASSGIGGLIGVVALMIMLPFLQPIVASFASPETFFLAILGISFVGVIGEGTPLRGLIAGAFGIFLSCIGEHRVTGVGRWWFDIDYLLDGFSVAVPALGLFAVPEIFSMMSTGRSVARDPNVETINWQQVRDGLRSTIVHRWILIRSALIGVVIGIIPGVGGETSPFLAYMAARQASKRPEAFGEGAIEGVIAPEASNNSKEGGALVPTLAFGIPGSIGMAVLIGGFIILGLEPGPEFLKRHLDIAFGLCLVLAFSNLIAAGVMVGLAAKVSLITRLDGRILGPIILGFVVLGAYSVSNKPYDVISVFVFGVLGWCLRRYSFSRPALLLGFVLGPLIETYLHISLLAHGIWFFTRPISLAIILCLVVGIAWPFIQRARSKGKGPDVASA